MIEMYKVDKFTKKNFLKIVIGGEGGVGKTSLSKRLTGKLREEEILVMTPGIDFYHLKIKNTILNCIISDLGGQEQFRNFQNDFFDGASIVILVFAVDTYFSYKKISSWFELLPSQMKNNIFLVGNKIDNSDRSVSMEEAFEFAEQKGLKYYEISTKNGMGFDHFKEDLIKTIEEIFKLRS